MTDPHTHVSAATEHLARLVYEAMRFAVWAAGQGLMAEKGEPTLDPEDFLFDYSKAMDIDDWDGLPEVAREAILNGLAQAVWMPIETAPRDGTDIIVYRPKFDGDYIPRVGTDYWMLKLFELTWARSRKDCPPTHWMHFPEPPK